MRKINLSSHRVTESQNGLVWKGLQRSSSSNSPAVGRTLTTRPGCSELPALNTCRVEPPHLLLATCFKCLAILTAKNFLLVSSYTLNILSSSLNLFPLVLPFTCSCRKSLSNFLVGFLHVLEGCKPSLFQAEETQLS